MLVLRCTITKLVVINIGDSRSKSRRRHTVNLAKTDKQSNMDLRETLVGSDEHRAVSPADILNTPDNRSSTSITEEKAKRFLIQKLILLKASGLSATVSL